ncbi:MAG TPA: SGNH/GDSL hydrolase family protein [Xanthomonadales bacterium]|nr:SGNH/GDSL hydrolase family protein [Xanthomonadales bacterium]
MKLLLSFVSLLIFILLVEVLLAFLSEREPFKNPAREYVYMGEKAKLLTYLIMGDSTTAGQGGNYKNGIAYSTARYLANDYQVKMFNTSISGATAGDVISDQLQAGIKINPDIVLLSVGANDITGLTNLDNLEKNLSIIIEKLIKNNCDVKIVLTGAPEMGSVRRFMQPLRYIAGAQTKRVNDVFEDTVAKYGLTFAPIAVETGEQFRKDASLFAEDKFHPNDRGYAIWIPVINKSLEKALHKQPSHCD